MTRTWFEHATFWSGVRRATIAPPSHAYRGKLFYNEIITWTFIFPCLSVVTNFILLFLLIVHFRSYFVLRYQCFCSAVSGLIISLLSMLYMYMLSRGAFYCSLNVYSQIAQIKQRWNEFVGEFVSEWSVVYRERFT